jgi:DNA-binding FadR family transcriptional regulator
MVEYSKLKAPSLKELFIGRLENDILSGRLSVGEKLPTERELADAMQVSRAIVNGGIADLERKGFLIVKPRVGTFVADFRRNGNMETLISIMNYQGGQLRKQEIRSILEVRIALDTLAVELLIPHITEEEIETLHAITETLRNAAAVTEAVEAAFAFQHELAILSGNTLIPLIFFSFKPAVYTLWQRFCDLYGIGALYDNTYRLWTFIRDRDAKGAAGWISESIHDSIDGGKPIYY